MIPQNAPSDAMKIISVCPVCNIQYNPMQAKIVDEIEEARLVHIQCKKCHSSVIAVIVQGGLGVTSVGLITDLDSDEVSVFKDLNPISVDEVLDVHTTLAKDFQLFELLPISFEE